MTLISGNFDQCRRTRLEAGQNYFTLFTVPLPVTSHCLPALSSAEREITICRELSLDFTLGAVMESY